MSKQKQALLQELDGALWSNRIDTVKRIICFDLDVNVKCGEHGETPLLLSRSLDMTRWLLSQGADVHARDNRGRTVLRFKIGKTGLSDDFDLLLQHGADINAVDDWDQTLLFFALWAGNPGIVQAVIDRGANVSGSDGESALSDAKGLGFVEIYRILRQAGAKDTAV